MSNFYIPSLRLRHCCHTLPDRVFTNAGATATFRLMVFLRAGSADTAIEIFSHNSADWNEHIAAEGSNTSPSNATHPGVISVGAVTRGLYGGAAGGSVIANYSSRGPSNGGMTVPDICGPTNTTCFTAPGSFGGTSCTTPNAAGAACVNNTNKSIIMEVIPNTSGAVLGQ